MKLLPSVALRRCFPRVTIEAGGATSPNEDTSSFSLLLNGSEVLGHGARSLILAVADHPPFLGKTYEMVDDPSIDSVVSWSQSNKNFIVQNLSELSRDLLLRFFKHNNFSSFIRKLNAYETPHIFCVFARLFLFAFCFSSCFVSFVGVKWKCFDICRGLGRLTLNSENLPIKTSLGVRLIL